MIPNKNKNGGFLGVIQDQESLSRLTLRQLRHKASDLGIPLYSRKSKASLIKQISLFQDKLEKEKILLSKKDDEISSKVNSESQQTSLEQTRVVFLPRDPEWAYVFWEIGDSDRTNAFSQGASRLSLRLVDVTGTTSGKYNPGILREVIVDSHSTEWYLPIPMGDRDYKVELGYRIDAQWNLLAVSSSARVPSQRPSNQILDQFVPFSLEINSGNISSDISLSEEPQDSGVLHERLYQSATTQFRKTRIGSEQLHESSKSQLDNFTDSGSGLWASGINESGIGGVVAKERSFWLVADAELIVYGSTDPSSKLMIGGEEVPLNNDGTFRLQVPFRDGYQTYAIEAIDSSGDQTRNITMRFERVTPEDNTNPQDKVESEWF